MTENYYLPHAGALDRLRVVTDRLQRSINKRLAGEKRPLPHQRVLCALLGKSDMTDAQVRVAIGMDSAQLSRQRKELVADGSVSVTPSPHHLSQYLLNLTDAGRKEAREIEEKRTAILIEDINRLAPAERQMMFNAVSQPNNANIRPPAPTIAPVGVDHMAHLLIGSQRYASEMGWTDDYVLEICLLLNTLFRYVSPKLKLGWLARTDIEPVGAALLERSVEFGSGTNLDLRPRIQLLYVSRHWRGQKVGTRLLDACLEECRKQEESTVLASVPARQRVAIKMFEKRGFRQIGKKVLREQYGQFIKWVDFEVRLKR